MAKKRGKAAVVVRSSRTKRGREALLAERPARQIGVDNFSDSFWGEGATTSVRTIAAPRDDLSPRTSADEETAPAHARAATLDGTSNPYQLQLSNDQLEALVHAAGAAGIHQLVGAFCALASIPQLVPPGTWLRQLTDDAPGLASFTAQLVQLHDEVVQRVDHGAIALLVPATDDESACASWARGYARYFDQVDGRFRTSETVVMRGFEIRVLAGNAEALDLLDELPEKDTLEETLAYYRERLSDSVAILRRRWLDVRRAPDPR